MNPRRLRSGELMAGAGAVALLLLLFFDWFGHGVRVRVTETSGRVVGPELHLSGWTSLGWLMVLMLLVALVLAAWLVVSTAIDATVSQAVSAGVLAIAAGSVALVALAVRVAIAQPGLGVGAPDELVTVKPPAYLGLAALALIVAGAWVATGDERTDAPESTYTPPPPRPAPPARS